MLAVKHGSSDVDGDGLDEGDGLGDALGDGDGDGEEDGDAEGEDGGAEPSRPKTVSYTHLTLPTILLV